MVSLWPWKANNTSTASFEKTLSTLSSKIAKATASLDACRQRARRYKALWTLYSSFVYILYLMIVALVIGWRNWGPTEYSAVAVAPALIYIVRLGLSTYYDYRTSNLQAYLNVLQKQRNTTIEKLKETTKYNTTQLLLEKYGGTPSKSKSSGPTNRKASANVSGTSVTQGGRTGFQPPPTANIPGRSVAASFPSTPQRPKPSQAPLDPSLSYSASAASVSWQQNSSVREDIAEFAPNAFSATPQYAQIGGEPTWYDRLMDLLLGEDETHPKNRLALVCKTCRLVNGQAPPGVKQLSDVGPWRCSGCRTMNGEESEDAKIVAKIKEETASIRDTIHARPETTSRPTFDSVDDTVLHGYDEDPDTDVTQYSEDEPDEKQAAPKRVQPESQKKPELQEEPELIKPKRGRPKGSVKKKA